MFALLYDPLREIRAIRKEGYGKLFLYLLAGSLFTSVGGLFLAWRFIENITSEQLFFGLFAALFGTMLFVLLQSFFFAVSFHILDGKAGYYDAFAALVLSLVAPAIGLFAFGVSVFLPYGVIYGSLLLGYGCVIGCATLARSVKEYFDLDYAGVLVGALIVKLPLIIAAVAVFVLL